jgi:hypothetical protein
MLHRIISELTCTFIHIYVCVSTCFLCLTVVVALGTSGRAALQCPVCPRTFVSKANLLVHAKNEHGDDRGPFSCSICGRIAKNKNSLRVHVYLYHRKNWKNEKQQYFTDLFYTFTFNIISLLTCALIIDHILSVDNDMCFSFISSKFFYWWKARRHVFFLSYNQNLQQG